MACRMQEADGCQGSEHDARDDADGAGAPQELWPAERDPSPRRSGASVDLLSEALLERGI